MEKSSWYPDPVHDIPLSQLPSIPQLANVKLSDKAVEEMRNYALAYGFAVRQRTNRQETVTLFMDRPFTVGNGFLRLGGSRKSIQDCFYSGKLQEQ